jgi:hypothetical protein
MSEFVLRCIPKAGGVFISWRQWRIQRHNTGTPYNYPAWPTKLYNCLAPQQGQSIRRFVLEKILKFKVNNLASVLAIPAVFTSFLVIRDWINSGGRISWFNFTQVILLLWNSSIRFCVFLWRAWWPVFWISQRRLCTQLMMVSILGEGMLIYRLNLFYSK